MNKDTLVLIASLVSIQLSKEMNSDQLALLSAFFAILGDNLALLSLSDCDDTEHNSPFL